MRKTIFIGVIVALSVAILYVISRFNKSPNDLNHYFECTKCHCVYGAMNRKGPYLKLPKNKGNWCIHNWVISSKEKFDEYASEFIKSLDAEKK